MARKGFFSGINGQSYDDFIRDQEAERRDYITPKEPPGEVHGETPVCENCGHEIKTEDDVHAGSDPAATGAVGVFLMFFGLAFALFGGIPMVIGFIVGELLLILIPMIFVVVGIIILVSGVYVFLRRHDPNLISVSVEKEGKY